MTEEEYSEEEEEEEILLGFAETPQKKHYLLRHFFPSKIGGKPAWLDPVNIPRDEETKCKGCGRTLSFLLQIYAPVDGENEAFHRTVFVFTCEKEECLRKNVGVRVFRCQLDRYNDFYSPDPPAEDQIVPPEHKYGTPAIKADFQSPWDEKELITDLEPEEGTEKSSQAEKLARDIQNLALEEGEENDFKEMESMTDANDRQWTAFQARLARAPSQCIRYCFNKDSKPLWPSLKQLPTNIPLCPLCNQERKFEFQILPQVLYYAGVDITTPGEIDFSCIAVYCCSCPTPGESIMNGNKSSYYEEYSWTQCMDEVKDGAKPL